MGSKLIAFYITKGKGKYILSGVARKEIFNKTGKIPLMSYNSYFQREKKKKYVCSTTINKLIGKNCYRS